ncbi:MAG: dihydrolipoamide acetyltransferase family protein [Pseudomonadota bacterium]
MFTVIEMPALSSTMKKGRVVRWCKQEGDFVEKGDTLYEVETDKVNVEVESLASGYIRKILLEEGIEAPVHTPIAIIAEGMDEDISSALLPGSSGSPLPSPHLPDRPEHDIPKGAPGKGALETSRIRISPLARRISEEEGIDVGALKGTGPGGRITKKDVEEAVHDRASAPPAQPEKEEERALEVKGYTDIPLTQMRKVIAKRLQESKVTAPHFYVDVTADASAVMKVREDLGSRGGGHEVKITVNDVLIKILSRALRDFPMVNAGFLEDRIRIHEAVNIGVAVAIDEGLIVPVIKNADRKSITRISREVRELAMKARNKKLLPHEYEGGTFTLTNMGMFGVETFHAIINPPESGILAVGAIIEKPVAREGLIVVRPCMKLSLSVDHRVVDGAMAARFLVAVKELVEIPNLLLA